MVRTYALIAALLIARTLCALHLPGGTITYTCQGDNYFEVKLQLIRECSGAEMVPHTLYFYSNTGIEFSVANMAPILVGGVSPLCPAEAGNSSCNGGSTAGFELYEYATTLFLSPAEEWTIYWSTCCRQNSVNIQSNPGLYIEAKLNSIAEACDASPQFNDISIPRVCLGHEVNYDGGATDADGHTLQYSLIDARFVSSLPPPELIVSAVNYVLPAYGAEPAPGMTIDAATGLIQFTPMEQGYVVVVVQVDEYNADGDWIGRVMRDFAFLVTTCSPNSSPAADSGNITGSTGSVVVENERSFRVCQGDPACVEIEFADPDGGQAVSVVSNVSTVMAGVSMDVVGTAPAEVNLCWDAITDAPGEYQFTITAMDDACPVMGSRTYNYTITVDDAPNAGQNGIATVCTLSPVFNLLDSLQGAPAVGGIWTGPDGQQHDGVFNPNVDVAGTYTYSIGAGNCLATSMVDVNFLPADDQYCIWLGNDDLELAQLDLSPNPNSGIVWIYNAPADLRKIEVVDMSGRSIEIAFRNENGRIEIGFPSDLANGSYLLRCMTSTGTVILRTQLLR
jgi:hypothetical protein